MAVSLSPTPASGSASGSQFGGSGPAKALDRPPRPSYVPPIRHVFVINIENKGYAETFGAGSESPYLAGPLRRKGVLLNSYYATAHNSLPNYIAQISGQAPNVPTQADCQVYSMFVPTGPPVAPGRQAVGTGCVLPKDVRSLPRQLTHAKLSWRGYMEQMRKPCRHPRLGSPDPTQHATPGHNYAVRHNPFMYFRSVTSRRAYCEHHVRPLHDLRHDLRHARKTPGLAYITPDLCRDGHDDTCANGRKGGLAQVDRFLKEWAPRILGSPAFKRNGMLIITADESDGLSDSGACCGEVAGPNPIIGTGPGITGPGGGRIGALVISHFTRPNTWSTTPYNHYSLLASLEELYRLPKLGMAAKKDLPVFGLDVYNNGWWHR
jgi:hypothetical protein